MEFIIKYLWLIPAAPLLAAGGGGLAAAKAARIERGIGHRRDQHFLPAIVRRLFGHAAFGAARTSNFRWFDFGATSVQLGWVLDPLGAIMAGDGDVA